jgi:hypothetical protein
VVMVRSEPTADASLAAILERSNLGMAIAAMIKMIATTISNSISVNPLSRFFMASPVSMTIPGSSGFLLIRRGN